MGPKKSDKKATKGADGEVLGEDPALFLQNYQRFSRLIGISANQKVVAQLQSDENQPLTQASVLEVIDRADRGRKTVSDDENLEDDI